MPGLFVAFADAAGELLGGGCHVTLGAIHVVGHAYHERIGLPALHEAVEFFPVDFTVAHRHYSNAHRCARQWLAGRLHVGNADLGEHSQDHLPIAHEAVDVVGVPGLGPHQGQRELDDLPREGRRVLLAHEARGVLLERRGRTAGWLPRSEAVTGGDAAAGSEAVTGGDAAAGSEAVTGGDAVAGGPRPGRTGGR